MLRARKKNGGIERFKTGKHGKGLEECGLIGFIEKEDSALWLSEINKWIKNLTEIDEEWKIEELLVSLESQLEFSNLISLARVNKTKNITLHHFWIEQVVNV